MTRYFIAFLFLWPAMYGVAEDTTEMNIAMLQEQHAFVAGFSQIKRIAGAAKPLESSGYIVVDPSRGVQWTTLKPFSHTQCWLVNDASMQSKIMLALIIGDVDQVSSYFSVQSEGERANWQIKLTPKHPEMAKVIKHIDVAQRNNIRYVNYWESAGHMTEMVFTKGSRDTDLLECGDE